MDKTLIRQKAVEELRQEEGRSQIEQYKQELRHKRRNLLYRIWFAIRYKKPTIKWEYRT